MLKFHAEVLTFPLKSGSGFSRFTTWLTNPILDPDATGRVTMDHLSRLLTSSLRRAYELGASDVDATMLQAVADLMILRRDEITCPDRVPFQEPDLSREVG